MTDDDDEDFEPLEVVPVPVRIGAHDPEVGGPSVVRLFFRGGAYSWPGGRISDVLVIEAADSVSIGLLRREVFGEAPDGTMFGESLAMGGELTLDVPLTRSVGSRSLLDASTGEVVPRVERRAQDPLPAEANGTPLWRWS